MLHFVVRPPPRSAIGASVIEDRSLHSLAEVEYAGGLARRCKAKKDSQSQVAGTIERTVFWGTTETITEVGVSDILGNSAYSPKNSVIL
ncbi:hypothetical protein LINPERHAP1_LOCUS26001 [Linum perenne]